MSAQETWDFLNVEPCANWRPTQGRVRVRKSVSHTIRHGARSIMRSVARRPDFDLPDLRELAGLSAELDAAICDAVANLRRQGHTWSAIAAELDVSKQAAFARYAGRVDEVSP